ncbi:g12099 [Coccomyxa viridis]|uniref:G12099 protein n=1 Tax=Coccomyxa viridis TaxID=1274662 RepID=A0ABP1G9H6_9CHLO
MKTPAILYKVCNTSASAAAAKTGAVNLTADCLLPSGVAGVFTGQQLVLLQCCIPGGIKLQEPDEKVTLPAMKFSSALQYNTITAASAQSPPPQPKVTAFAAGGRRAMKGPADSPLVSLTGEDFRSAETWEYADDGPVAGGRRRAMQQQPAAGPMVTVGQEQFRDASSWETVVSNLTSSDAAYEVQGYGGERPPLYSHMHLAETIGPVASYPTIDMSKLNNGEGPDSTSDSLKVQVLPDNGVLWNLDRIDQRKLPLNREYTYGSKTSDGTGRGTTVYVVDSGISTTHQEFKSAATGLKRASFGVDFIGNFSQTSPIQDCDGHGTHVASIAVGRNVGVAKEASVVAVRVLDCEGTGTISDLVAGLDWVASNAKQPAVATLSLGVPVGQWSQSLEQAARNLITKYNVTVIVASGNSEEDSCYISPGTPFL